DQVERRDQGHARHPSLREGPERRPEDGLRRGRRRLHHEAVQPAEARGAHQPAPRPGHLRAPRLLGLASPERVPARFPAPPRRRSPFDPPRCYHAPAMRFIRVAVPVPIDDTFVYEFPENEEPEPGLRVLVPFGRRQLWGTIVGEERERPARAIRPIVGIPEPRLTLTPELIELCRWVAEYYAAPLGEVLHAAAPSPAALKRRAVADSPADEPGWHASPPPARSELNEDQAAALHEIESALHERAFRPFLLHGVTGSGKTAVYMHAALTAIRQHGQALILVPEIALSPQALDAFRQGGIERVALYHSTLRPRERAEVWHRAAEGSLDLVVGTRSAVFVPFRDLRLIAVDEEQDGAYKQEDSPRYHARDVALVRAKRLGATLVLASATPSLESYAKAASGATTLLRLPRRVD